MSFIIIKEKQARVFNIFFFGDGTVILTFEATLEDCHRFVVIVYFLGSCEEFEGSVEGGSDLELGSAAAAGDKIGTIRCSCVKILYKILDIFVLNG